jgi:hypothetical protein
MLALGGFIPTGAYAKGRESQMSGARAETALMKLVNARLAKDLRSWGFDTTDPEFVDTLGFHKFRPKRVQPISVRMEQMRLEEEAERRREMSR